MQTIRPIGNQRISPIGTRLLVAITGKIHWQANVLTTSWISFLFSWNQVPGNVESCIYVTLPLEETIWGLFYKVKQVYLHLHSCLSIGKTRYNKIIGLPFECFTTEEQMIKLEGI